MDPSNNTRCKRLGKSNRKSDKNICKLTKIVFLLGSPNANTLQAAFIPTKGALNKYKRIMINATTNIRLTIKKQ